MTETFLETSESRELQGPAGEGMRRVGDTDLALPFFRDPRGATLVAV